MVSKYLTPLVIALGISGASILPGSGAVAQGNDNPGNKVTLCHRTGSNSNPYVQISVNANGAVSGHDGHDGPIFPAKGSDGKWGDVIPPFDYNDHGNTAHYPGKNWNATGQAILRNGCKVSGGQGGNITPPNPPTPPTAGGQGGQVLGASGGQAGVSSLPNTGLLDEPGAWSTFAVVVFFASSLYWREMIAPRGRF